MYQELLKAFITLFVIMEPFGSVPIFIAMTSKMSLKQKVKNVNNALIVAAALLFLFLLFGVQVFNFFRISISSFEIAGGIVLLLIGIIYVLGLKIKTEKERIGKDSVAAIPIGTPLLTGPGVITSTVILVDSYGMLITAIAAAITLALSWLVLRYSGFIYRMLGEHGSQILSRIMGLILAAIAVEFIRIGIVGMSWV